MPAARSASARLVIALAAMVVAVGGALGAQGRCGDDPINFARSPTWSPDGRKIAFECSGICVMDADGTHKSTLIQAPGDAVDRQPAWSPDGRRIAFVRQLRSTFLYYLLQLERVRAGAR